MREQLDFHSGRVFSRVGEDNQWFKLKTAISWESFRKILSELDGTSELGGRPPYDPVAMFRVVLLGQWHDLSDAELEQSLRVRLDFMMFCGFALSDDVPDSTTIQDFRSRMIKAGLMDKCLKLLNRKLEESGLKVKSGKLVLDSTVIQAAARPRNIITPGDDDESPSQSNSADPDAKWTKKGKQYHYGYKEHALVDRESGFIEDVHVTSANRHDGTMLKLMLKGKRRVQELLADKAYCSRDNRRYLKSRNIKDSILFRAARSHPLSRTEIARNKKISSRRFVGEQQFGTKKRKFRFARTRYFGLLRVQAQAYLKAFCFNLLKAVRQIIFLHPQPA